MSVRPNKFALGIRAPAATSKAAGYRPPSWPPPRDWPVCVDDKGKVVSRWGDAIWDLSPMAGVIFSLNFGDGPECRTDRLDHENADLLRMAMTWVMWGHRPAKARGTIQMKFTTIRTVIAVCSRAGVNAASLMRYPKVLEQVQVAIPPSRYETTISNLHRLYDARDVLGFTIVDANGLRKMAEAAPGFEHKQTPYIPPRIWLYQVERLRECVTDFLAYQQQIRACFEFCLAAYLKNFGSLAAALEIGRDSDKSPFTRNALWREGVTFFGPFCETAAEFGLTELFEKWQPQVGGARVTALSTYMTLVCTAGIAYIANFTLQRKEEAASLRSDCLVWEEDANLGRVLLVRGETTKTEQDSDARWVASPSVEFAVQALSIIAELRMMFDQANPEVRPTPQDRANPYLYSAPNEPWASGVGYRPYGIRVELPSLKEIMRDHSSLFDADRLRITSEDLKLAKRLTPDLSEERFAVGKTWPLAWHQLRRTVAVNMFASGLISDSSMQMQMKHCSRLMPLYYGRGYTRLLLNEEVEGIVINAMYVAMTERLRAAVTGRFISPRPDGQAGRAVVQLIAVQDVKQLLAWAKAGKVSFREHRLGGCLKNGSCEYGGVESVARCAAGDVPNPCPEVVYDRERESQVRADLADVDRQIARLPSGAPRREALVAERRAMRNYLNAIAAD